MKFRFAIWIALTLVLASFANADSPLRELEPSTEPIHVRVLFMGNAANEAVVSWTTTAEGDSHKLYVDTQPKNGEVDAYESEFPSIHSQPYTLREEEEEAGMHAWTHNVLLEDLEPATRYYLTAVSDGEASGEYYFKTAPDDDSPVSLIYSADSQISGETRHQESPGNWRRRMNKVMRHLFEGNPEVIAMAHGGDYDNNAYWLDLYYWLKDYWELTTTEDGRLLPIIPARGNHDMQVGFEEMFWWPDRTHDYYYTTHLNADTALITLNTEIDREGAQLEWLESELADLSRSKKWLLAQYHRPAYGSVRGTGKGARERSKSWVELFERYGMNLVMEAHDHALKRTHPIYNEQIDEERGVVYIGEGGAGGWTRQVDPDRWYLARATTDHHVHMLNISEHQISGIAKEMRYDIVDQFALSGNQRPLLAGLERPGELSARLGRLLDSPHQTTRNAARLMLQNVFKYSDGNNWLRREEFLDEMENIFGHPNKWSSEERRLAYQMLLIHADFSNGDNEKLIQRGVEDESEDIRRLASLGDMIDLNSEAGRTLVHEFRHPDTFNLAEEVFVAAVNRPSLAFPRGTDEEDFEKVDSFQLPKSGWRFRKDPEHTGYFRGYAEPDHDTQEWMPIEIEAPWGQFLDTYYAGAGWYRATIEVPKLEEHDALGLHFGGVDENGWVWIDGEYAGQHNIGPAGWDVPFQLDVTDLIEPGKEHQITVRVKNDSRGAGIWKPVELRAFSR